MKILLHDNKYRLLHEELHVYIATVFSVSGAAVLTAVFVPMLRDINLAWCMTQAGDMNYKDPVEA